jgi:hypothetical protein
MRLNSRSSLHSQDFFSETCISVSCHFERREKSRSLPFGRLCENSIGALRLSSGRTVKYLILLTPQPVRAEVSRSMDGVFTQSVSRDDNPLR